MAQRLVDIAHAVVDSHHIEHARFAFESKHPRLGVVPGAGRYAQLLEPERHRQAKNAHSSIHRQWHSGCLVAFGSVLVGCLDRETPGR